MPYKDPEDQRACQRRKYQRLKQEKNARSRITYRIKVGQMPRASFFTCADCSAQAIDYHHESYDHWWHIEALCKPCHAKRHRHDNEHH